MRTKHTQRGYTLLFAVITAALVLGVAAFIVGVARKQYIIAATTRDSVYALYAADSGIECIAESGPGNYDLSVIGPDNKVSVDSFSCNGRSSSAITFQKIDSNINPSADIPTIFNTDFAANPIFVAPPPTNGGATDYISLDFVDENNNHDIGCALFRIWRQDTPKQTVYVESRGYNACTLDINLNRYKPSSSVRTVERGLSWWIKSI